VASSDPSPDTLESDIEATRARLAATIDQLAYRASPKTIVKRRWAQYLVVVLVAIVETLLRLAEVIYAPFYALTIVGPAALAIEIWYDSRTRAQVTEKVVAA